MDICGGCRFQSRLITETTRTFVPAIQRIFVLRRGLPARESACSWDTRRLSIASPPPIQRRGSVQPTRFGLVFRWLTILSFRFCFTCRAGQELLRQTVLRNRNNSSRNICPQSFTVHPIFTSP